MNADRGAWSMELSIDLHTSNTMVKGRFEAAGRRPRKIELGRCVATIASIKPRRLAREDAKTLPMVDMNLVGMVSMSEATSNGNDDAPCCGHDAAQFSLGELKLPLEVKVDETKGYKT